MKVTVLYENVYLNSYPYSKYQKYIFEQIIKFRKMGYSDRKISNYFNENDKKQLEIRNLVVDLSGC